MKNWTGHRFSWLVATKFISKNSGKHRYYWEFLCDCGKTTIKEISDVKRKSTRSCGCKRKQLQSEAKYIEPGLAAFNNILHTYKKTAKSRNLEFNLKQHEFKHLLDSNCFYCNKPPSQIKKSKISSYIYNGIDRVDNSIGYTLSNCVSSCTQCNLKKGAITLDMVNKIYERNKP